MGYVRTGRLKRPRERLDLSLSLSIGSETALSTFLYSAPSSPVSPSLPLQPIPLPSVPFIPYFPTPLTWPGSGGGGMMSSGQKCLHCGEGDNLCD